MSESNRTLRDELIKTKDDKEYRHAYAEENLNATIATQIKVLREQRHWKQEDLAREAGMKQPMISRYEDVNYSSWSLRTLEKFAEAFDVYLDVRFRSFRELVKIADSFSREALEVLPFTKDPFFQEPQPVASHEIDKWIAQIHSQSENVRNILSELRKTVQSLVEQQREVPQAGVTQTSLKLLQPMGGEPAFPKSVRTPQPTIVEPLTLPLNPSSKGSLENEGERRITWLNRQTPMPVQ